MSAPALLKDLRARGVNVSAKASKLVYDAPPGVLTDADRAGLRTHKVEILALLTPVVSTPGGASKPLAGRRAPKEHFSREPIPTVACSGCSGRAWRLRETPASAGGWLWVCPACADAVQAVADNGPPKKT